MMEVETCAIRRNLKCGTNGGGWIEMMEKEILDWLLEGPAWLSYAVEKQLLDRKPVAEPALNDPAIRTLVSNLKGDQGLRALKTGKISYTNRVYWDLFFLADIGFDVDDLGLEREARTVFDLQSEDGKFIAMNDMKPDFFCIPTILLSSLKRMACTDPGLDEYIRVIKKSQRLDGGWHCAQQRAVGRRLQDSDSCPMDNLNVLMLLGQFEEYQRDPGLKGALDLLLRHWEKQNEQWRPYGFGIGTDFKRLKYPAVKYGILRVLDVLSLFPHAVESKSFQGMIDFVRRKSRDGKYLAESVVKFYSEFDFGQKKEPSRWITFLVQRIEKRIAGDRELLI